jgi:hypothetical protein
MLGIALGANTIGGRRAKRKSATYPSFDMTFAQANFS